MDWPVKPVGHAIVRHELKGSWFQDWQVGKMKFRHYVRPSRLCWVGLAASLVGLNGCGMPGSGLLLQDSNRQEATPEISGSMDNQWRQLHELLDEAKANVEQFELDAAISQCTELLQHVWPIGTRNLVQDSFQAEVYLWRGRAFLAKGFPFIAVDDLDDAVELSDRALKPDAYVQRARAASVLRRWSRAVADCSQAIRLQPNHGEAYLVRSQALAEMGQQELARNSLLEAERLGVRTSFKVPEPVPVVQQARQLLDQGKPGLARELLGRALLTGFNSSETNGLLARAQLELAEYYRAMAACNRALRLDPSYAEAYRIRGLAQYHRDDLDQAIVDLKSALELDPSLGDSIAPFLTSAQREGWHGSRRAFGSVGQPSTRLRVQSGDASSGGCPRTMVVGPDGHAKYNRTDCPFQEVAIQQRRRTRC